MGIGFNVHTAAVCYLLFYAHQIALAPSMSFYPDFILILSWFYPDVIQILSR
jgi:hypothetical protein